MSSSLHVNKRLLQEITRLTRQQNEKPLCENDYLIHVDDSNMTVVHAIIKAPHDSVYRHKFVRLDIEIPDNYPHSPPSVTFVNHDNVRIHPNMYEDGKCCATILNTWGDSKFEKWTSSMGIETILLTFLSFLDNNPYTYEPGGHDDPSYTVYVLFQSWTTCLIRYLQRETIELFTSFIHNYLMLNIGPVFDDLLELTDKYPYGYYFTRCFEVDNYIIDYQRVTQTLEFYFNYIEFKGTDEEDPNEEEANEHVCEAGPSSAPPQTDLNFICSICFDTELNDSNFTVTSCNHKFHFKCLEHHVKENGDVCPICRTEFKLTNWIISPITKRRVKVGSKTWQYLFDNGHI